MGWLNYVGLSSIMAFDFSTLLPWDSGLRHHKAVCPMTKEHLQAARLCHKVYDDDYLHAAERFVDSESTNVQCAMTFEDHKLFVVFRGTDDMVDWYHNFQANLVKYPANSESEFHAGFLVQWLSVKQEVENKIVEMIQSRRDAVDAIVLTGHSAGCPSACLCAIELANVNNIDVRVVTFGSPRFANDVFKEDFEENKKISCSRIVLDRDLVTRFPVSYTYAHVGKPLQLRGDHVLERDTSVLETIQWCLLGIPRMDLGFRDHDVQNYVKEIEKLLTK